MISRTGMAVRIMPIVTICVNQFNIDVPTACFEFEGALFDPRGICCSDVNKTTNIKTKTKTKCHKTKSKAKTKQGKTKTKTTRHKTKTKAFSQHYAYNTEKNISSSKMNNFSENVILYQWRHQLTLSNSTIM